MLKLAIEQYEQIVKIEPNNVDDHLLLGRLYRLNNDLQKAETELKIAVKLDPDSEEAVTTLAILYSDEGDTAHAPASAELGSRLRPFRQALCRARRDLRAAQGIQERDRRLQKGHRSSIATISMPFAASRENLLNDGQIDAALEQYKVIADANPEDAQTLSAHGGDLPPPGQVRSGAGEPEKGRVHGAGLAGSPLQHGGRLPSAGPLRRRRKSSAGPGEENRKAGQPATARRAE